MKAGVLEAENPKPASCSSLVLRLGRDTASVNLAGLIKKKKKMLAESEVGGSAQFASMLITWNR